MSTFIEYLQYPFFLRALLVGGIMSVLLSWMSGYVVLRQEVLFTHALSNIGFLGIALAILLNLPITPMLMVASLLAALLIRFIQSRRIFQNDSLLEIFSQMGLALGIIVVAAFPGYRVNIEQFLFGDILGVTRGDFWMSIGLLLVIGSVLLYLHKVFLRVSISDLLSHTLVQKKKFYLWVLTFLLAILIAMAMKIVGVLLVAAFTTIPANSAKLFAKNLKQTFIFSILIGLIATFFGFYFSVFLNLPSGPLVVCILGLFWILGILKKGREA